MRVYDEEGREVSNEALGLGTSMTIIKEKGERNCTSTLGKSPRYTF